MLDRAFRPAARTPWRWPRRVAGAGSAMMRRLPSPAAPGPAVVESLCAPVCSRSSRFSRGARRPARRKPLAPIERRGPAGMVRRVRLSSAWKRRVLARFQVARSNSSMAPSTLPAQSGRRRVRSGRWNPVAGSSARAPPGRSQKSVIFRIILFPGALSNARAGIHTPGMPRARQPAATSKRPNHGHDNRLGRPAASFQFEDLHHPATRRTVARRSIQQERSADSRGIVHCISPDPRGRPSTRGAMPDNPPLFPAPCSCATSSGRQRANCSMRAGASSDEQRDAPQHPPAGNFGARFRAM